MENCHVFSTRRKEIRITELAKKVGRVIINQKLLNFINYEMLKRLKVLLLKKRILCAHLQKYLQITQEYKTLKTLL